MSARPEDVTRMRNVRDVGGLPVTGGGRTRDGVLLRSDAPRDGDPPPDGVAWPPRLVIDLRSEEEAPVRHPLADDGAVHVLPLSAEAAIDGLTRSGPGGLGALYASIVESAGPLFVRAAELLADAPSPALVHCTAGKDRTGLVLAVLLDAIGVDRDAVVADYAATQANMAGVIARIETGPPRPGGLDWPTVLAQTDPEILTAPAEIVAGVLRTMDGSGGTAAWLRGHGLRDGTLERLRERLVA